MSSAASLLLDPFFPQDCCHFEAVLDQAMLNSQNVSGLLWRQARGCSRLLDDGGSLATPLCSR